jgi:hypothetical protein
VERLRRVAPVCLRIGERADHVEELDERAGPTVREDQRERVRLGGADVQEVDVLPVDRGRELRDLVQALLDGPPVELVAPAAHQLTHRVHADAVVAARRELLGVAGAGEPVGEVVEVGLGDVDAEGRDLHEPNGRKQSGKVRS